MRDDPSFIGTVQDVAGTTVTVALTEDTATGVSFISGECYKVGQVGSFVRIPVGFNNLYGLVSQVGAGAAPLGEQENQPYGNRWLQVQLVGEGYQEGHFQRGVSQHPTIEDKVHIVTENDLKSIYGPGDPSDFVAVGHLASAESIPAFVDINKLVTRHAAIVGTTGCGKSTTVAGLLHSLSDSKDYPSSRILVLDIHGEYGKALRDRANIFKIGADDSLGEKELEVPFWALNSDEFTKFAFGNSDDKGKFSTIYDLMIQLKNEALKSSPISGLDAESLTVDLPTPFSLHKLWYELYKKEFMTVMPRPGGNPGEEDPAYAEDESGNPMIGDAMSAKPPLFKTVKTTGKKEEQINWGREGIGIRKQLLALGTKLRDPRYDFICNPGGWKPNIGGCTEKDLDELLEGWIGNSKPITILDLSGIPSGILTDIIGTVLRIIYDAVFWGRNLPEGARERPLLLVLEEAHTFLRKENSTSASDAVKRIAKEGRKYGVGIMVVSQRPSEIDTTILSQCGTTIAMRLANNADRGHVTGAASDNLKGLFDMLPILRTGEAIIVGEAASLPIRTIIEPPPPDRKPDSTDPKVVTRGSDEDGFESPGGWNQDIENERYDIMVHQWRSQSAKYDHELFKESQSEEGED